MLVPNIENFSYFYYTGSSSLEQEITVADNDIRLVSIDFTFDTSVSTTGELLTVTLSSHRTSPSTDVEIYSKDFHGLTSFSYTFDPSILAEKNDVITLSWDNTNSITYNITLNYVNRVSVWRLDTTFR